MPIDNGFWDDPPEPETPPEPEVPEPVVFPPSVRPRPQNTAEFNAQAEDYLEAILIPDYWDQVVAHLEAEEAKGAP